MLGATGEVLVGTYVTDFTNATYSVSSQVCGKAFSTVQYDWEHNFHLASVGILFVFAFQLVSLMFVYNLHFFKSAAYVVDTIVVGAALVLENISVEGNLFVLLLFWRALRVVHGILSTVEINASVSESKAAATGAAVTEKHLKRIEEQLTIAEDIEARVEPQMNRNRELLKKVGSGPRAEVDVEALSRDYLELCDCLQELKSDMHKMRDEFQEDHTLHTSHGDDDKHRNAGAHTKAEGLSLEK